MALYVIIGIAIILVIYTLLTYNSLIKSNNFVKEAFSLSKVMQNMKKKYLIR